VTLSEVKKKKKSKRQGFEKTRTNFVLKRHRIDGSIVVVLPEDCKISSRLFALDVFLATFLIGFAPFSLLLPEQLKGLGLRDG
jgi:hypothetical protein